MESTASRPQRAPDAHTPEYHRVLRDVHQHSSVAEQTEIMESQPLLNELKMSLAFKLANTLALA